MMEREPDFETVDAAADQINHQRQKNADHVRTEEKASTSTENNRSTPEPMIAQEKPRLAYLTGQYPRATDTFIQREVATLRDLGYHVQTFSVRKPPGRDSGGLDTAAERNATLYLLPPSNLLRAHLLQFVASPKRYMSALALAVKTGPAGLAAKARQFAYFAEAGILAKLMKDHSLVHLHNHLADSSCSVAALAAQIGGFTFSFTIHGPAEFYEPNLWWIDEKVRRALFVNCISHFCRSQAMVFSPADCWEKLRIVHCGVDPALFKVKSHVGRGERLLFVGRLAAAKGLPILLEAIARIDGVTLNIAGDGPERHMLEQTARTLGLWERVKFLGYQSQEQVRELLKESDLFVLSSFAEGVPVVLMEAMAAGVPVIATRIAGIPELVENGSNGSLVSPGDVDSTVDAVRRLLDDPDLRNSFASAGRETIERDFNIRKEASWLATILASAFAGRSVPLRP
ncbi:colanic acid/amylovoran biosynthesis glycosyltransferase [Bradyrhizobium sp. F1.4.3]|uniref:glycosyltransferase n=1 Tax=Bradyrhizobium sp. F1.4.3 TaxID=3156356 RepID=UPI003390B0EB